METEARLTLIEDRIQALEDREQIRELAVRYCKVVDDMDAVALRAMFTEDAWFHSANEVMDGRGLDAVVETLSGRWHTILTSMHITHGHVVELDLTDADRATGMVFSHAEVVRDGKPMLSAVQYDDVYRRVDEQWRFAERQLSFFYYVDVESYAADLMSGTPVNAGATALPADVPTRSGP